MISHFSNGLISRLLLNYTEQQIPYQPSSGLFMSAYSILFAPPLAEGQCAIAEQSLLILLLVSNQPVDSVSYPWRDSILTHSSKESSSPLMNAEMENRSSFK